MLRKNKYIFILFLGYIGVLLLQLNFLFLEETNKKDILFNISLNLACLISYVIYFINYKKKIYLDVANFFSFIPLLFLISILTVFLDSIFIFFLGINNIYYLINCAVEMLIVVFIIKKYYSKDYTDQWDKFTFDLAINLLKVVVYYFLAVYLSIFAFLIVMHLNLEEAVPANQQAIEETIARGGTFFYIMLIFVAPFVEEFFFRYLLIEKILFNFVKDKNNLTSFEAVSIIIISTGIFAFMHAFAATSVIYFIRDMIIYSSLSLVLTIAYVKERNIYLNIALHFLNNFMSIL